MDEKMQELLIKMRELGISEEEFRRTLNTTAAVEAEKPADKEAFDKAFKDVRNNFRDIIKEIYKDSAQIDETVFKPVMSPTIFKTEFRELAIAEVVRLVRFLDEVVIKLSDIKDRAQLREVFFNMMVAYEDVVYGYISLFRFVPIEVLYVFVSKVGADKSAAYAIIKDQRDVGLVNLKTKEDIEKAKEDMINLMASVFRNQVDRTFADIYAKEFVRLVPLKDYAFEDFKVQNDIFIAYGTLIGLLLLGGLIRTQTILKMALVDLKFEVAQRENASEILILLGNIE